MRGSRAREGQTDERFFGGSGIGKIGKLLDEVSDGVRHLLDVGGVVGLNILEVTGVVLGDEVDGNSLTTETSRTTDTMDVVLTVGWEIVVDDKGDLENDF